MNGECPDSLSLIFEVDELRKPVQGRLARGIPRIAVCRVSRPLGGDIDDREVHGGRRGRVVAA
jgi:hypothetical protein